MKSDYTTFSIFTVLGIILIITYYICYKTSNKINYWTNNGKNVINGYKNAYIFMIILSTIAGLYLMYYLSFEIPNKKIFNNGYSDISYIVHISVLILIGFSIMWVPSILAHETIITNMCLFMAAVGAFMILLITINTNNRNVKDNAAITMAAILLFQTFILDFLIWTNLINL